MERELTTSQGTLGSYLPLDAQAPLGQPLEPQGQTPGPYPTSVYLRYRFRAQNKGPW